MIKCRQKKKVPIKSTCGWCERMYKNDKTIKSKKKNPLKKVVDGVDIERIVLRYYIYYI